VSEEPQLIINSGKRVLVKLPDFIGYAGFVEGPNGIDMAYLPNRRGTTEPGISVVVDEETFLVEAVRASDAVQGMRVLTLARPKAAD
jgi:hypothetical protein